SVGGVGISDFEPAVPGDYYSTNLPGPDGWTVIGTNKVRVIDNAAQADSVPRYLSLLDGQIERSLPTTAGQNYTLTYAARAETNCFTYPNFNLTNGINVVGNAGQAGGAIRLTSTTLGQTGDAWFADKQQVRAGFDTTFDFRFTDAVGNGAGGDGITF